MPRTESLPLRAFGAPEPVGLTPDAISRNPRFTAACACQIDAILGFYENRPFRGLSDYACCLCVTTIICLDAGYRPDVPATYVTLPRLRAVLAQRSLLDNRLADFVKGLHHDGFLEREPAPNDKRVLLLRPTEKLRAADREWLAIHHTALAFLYPNAPAYRRALDRDPRYQSAYRRAALTQFATPGAVDAANPAVGFFLGHDVGFRVLMILMRAVWASGLARTPPGFYTAAEARAGASRTHIRHLMTEAAQRGLVRLSEPPGRYVEVLAPLREGVERFIAASLADVDRLSRHAIIFERADSP